MSFPMFLPSPCFSLGTSAVQHKRKAWIICTASLANSIFTDGITISGILAPLGVRQKQYYWPQLWNPKANPFHHGVPWLLIHPLLQELWFLVPLPPALSLSSWEIPCSRLAYPATSHSLPASSYSLYSSYIYLTYISPVSTSPGILLRGRAALSSARANNGNKSFWILFYTVIRPGTRPSIPLHLM